MNTKIKKKKTNPGKKKEKKKQGKTKFWETATLVCKRPEPARCDKKEGGKLMPEIYQKGTALTHTDREEKGRCELGSDALDRLGDLRERGGKGPSCSSEWTRNEERNSFFSHLWEGKNRLRSRTKVYWRGGDTA